MPRPRLRRIVDADGIVPLETVDTSDWTFFFQCRDLSFLIQHLQPRQLIYETKSTSIVKMGDLYINFAAEDIDWLISYKLNIPYEQ